MAQKTDPLDIAKWGILIAGGYLVFKIFKGTGLIKDVQSQAVDNLNLQIDQKVWTKPTFWKLTPPMGYESMLFTQSSTQDLIKKIHNSVGLLNDCEDCIIGILKSINYQTQYSWLAYNFYNKYGKDMTAFIKGAFNSNELYPGWQHLETRPPYKKK